MPPLDVMPGDAHQSRNVRAAFMRRVKNLLSQRPILGTIARRLYQTLVGVSGRRRSFPGSRNYWEQRYASGGNSGYGSHGALARYKAEIVNAFVAENRVRSVIEFGCGDGNQLMLANYPSYIGFDVSETAIARCKEIFADDATKRFELTRNYIGQAADLGLSLDVIYHLIEDEVFDDYMRLLFRSSERYVVIYSSDSDDTRRYEGPHVRHRHFSRWAEQNLPEWRLAAHVPNRFSFRGDYETSTFADFFFYERRI